jgi:lactobin A/cerein 7B family class IIb bacteriocin
MVRAEQGTSIMSMHTTETNRCLTDAELDDVNGGVVAVVAGAIGLFGLGMIVGMSGCWEDLPAGAPRTLDQLYASWK